MRKITYANSLLLLFVLLGCQSVQKDHDIDFLNEEYSEGKKNNKIDLETILFTISAKDISFIDAIRYVCLRGGLIYRIEKFGIVICTPDFSKKIDFFQVPKDMSKLLEESPQKTIQNYLKQLHLIPGFMRITYDKTTKHLIVTGTESNMEILKSVLSEKGLVILPEGEKILTKVMQKKMNKKMSIFELKSASIIDAVSFLQSQSKKQSGPNIFLRLPPVFLEESE
jgi:hypothetical protein